MLKTYRPYVFKRNIDLIGYSIWVRWVVSTNSAVRWIWIPFRACRRKVVYLCFITSPGKIIFAVLELLLSPLQWVLSW